MDNSKELQPCTIPKYSKQEQERRKYDREEKKRQEEAEKRRQKYLLEKKRQTDRRTPSPIRRREERRRFHLKRKSGLNWGLPKVRAIALKEADLNPLPSKVIKRAHMDGKGKEIRKEVARRREGRKEAGLRAEKYFEEYKKIREGFI